MRLLRLFTTINDTICDVEGVDRVLVVDVTCTSHFVLDGLDEIGGHKCIKTVLCGL
jgi:hypothetical protein